MRLIDADYILEGLGHFNDRVNGNQHFLNGIETAKEITENAPTIDAMTVEWLRKKIDGYAAKLKSTELAALVTVMQMWEQEGGGCD